MSQGTIGQSKVIFVPEAPRNHSPKILSSINSWTGVRLGLRDVPVGVPYEQSKVINSSNEPGDMFGTENRPLRKKFTYCSFNL